VVFESGLVKLVSTLESTMGHQQAQLQLPSSCKSATFCKATSKLAVSALSVVQLPPSFSLSGKNCVCHATLCKGLAVTVVPNWHESQASTVAALKGTCTAVMVCRLIQ
jgi:hypothetical protein